MKLTTELQRVLKYRFVYFSFHAQLCYVIILGLLKESKVNSGNTELWFFFLWLCDPTRVMASSLLRFLDHKRRTSQQDSSGRVTSSTQRPLPDNTQHSQHTNKDAPGGIRTHDLSRRAAADLRLRPCGHWDRHQHSYVS